MYLDRIDYIFNGLDFKLSVLVMKSNFQRFII